MPKLSRKHWLVMITAFILTAGLLWLATSGSSLIWPYRNTLQYHTLMWWWRQVGYPQPGQPGALGGIVRDTAGRPVANAWVLVSWWDGATHTTRSQADGRYTIAAVPAGQYLPVAAAPGYADTQLNHWVAINPGAETLADLTLSAAPIPSIIPGQNLSFDTPSQSTCPAPLEASAIRQSFTFDSGGQPNQPALYYTPAPPTTLSQWPVLLVVYPGPAASWECASLPLAAAGHAVVAVGPAYSLNLEADVDELERIIGFIRAGQFPGSDGTRLALLGGSYSSLHVQRLLQRQPDYQAAVLLGPPVDLFDMRRRLEERTFVPPFGLDQVMIALGLPDREPLRYWSYSGAYHIRPDFPPLIIMHSRSDEVVPFQQSELFSANLTQVGVAHELHIFEGASHYLLAEGSDKDTLEIYRITLEFLARHLKK